MPRIISHWSVRGNNCDLARERDDRTAAVMTAMTATRRTEGVTCSSENGNIRKCPLSEACDVESVSVVFAQSMAPCVKGYSYSASSSALTVSKGCQGTFTVGCRACTSDF
ncbi:hypothetical protein RRG08_013258 [Elysia crispata]|uniref:Uncharacterized protein n=1 Tax=Elysia crispata TaxID=231223 RepID=A0AAE1DL85_9GAST|nr:hypothetical protein RRG08_013258 [Elysia crispata]